METEGNKVGKGGQWKIEGKRNTESRREIEVGKEGKEEGGEEEAGERGKEEEAGEREMLFVRRMMEKEATNLLEYTERMRKLYYKDWNSFPC